jgi:hypothetical protein
MKTILRLVFSFVLLTVMSGNTARAQQIQVPSTKTGSPTPVAVQMAQRHYKTGLALAKRQLWEAALAEFEASRELHELCDTVFNIGRCHQNLRHWNDSLDVYDQYLANCPSAPQHYRARVHQFIAEIQALVTPVRLDVFPPGARIVIEGFNVGTSPLAEPRLLHSGQHHIEVTLDGYETYSDDLMVVLGRPVYRRIELLPIQDTGLLRVRTVPPDADITIDDHDAGSTPFEGQLRPGVHIVTVDRAGYREEVETVTIEEGGERELEIELRRNRLRREWFWSMVGLTAISGAAFATLGATALSYGDHGLDTRNPEYYDVYNDGHGLMLAADIMLGITCVAALSTLVMGFFTDWSRRQGDEDSRLEDEPRPEGNEPQPI